MRVYFGVIVLLFSLTICVISPSAAEGDLEEKLDNIVRIARHAPVGAGVIMKPDDSVLAPARSSLRRYFRGQRRMNRVQRRMYRRQMRHYGRQYRRGYRYGGGYGYAY